MSNCSWHNELCLKQAGKHILQMISSTGKPGMTLFAKKDTKAVKIPVTLQIKSGTEKNQKASPSLAWLNYFWISACAWSGGRKKKGVSIKPHLSKLQRKRQVNCIAKMFQNPLKQWKRWALNEYKGVIHKSCSAGIKLQQLQECTVLSLAIRC